MVGGWANPSAWRYNYSLTKINCDVIDINSSINQTSSVTIIHIGFPSYKSWMLGLQTGRSDLCRWGPPLKILAKLGATSTSLGTSLHSRSVEDPKFDGKLSPRNGSFRATFRFFFLGTFRIKRQWEMQQTCSQWNCLLLKRVASWPSASGPLASTRHHDVGYQRAFPRPRRDRNGAPAIDHLTHNPHEAQAFLHPPLCS